MSAAYNKFFINGEWIEPEGRETLEVVNPATEKAFATISMVPSGTSDKFSYQTGEGGESNSDNWCC